MSIKSPELIDLWPEGVGYDKLEGLTREQYDSKKDNGERLESLIASWKATALAHGFNDFKWNQVMRLSCPLSVSDNTKHQLFFWDKHGQDISFSCKVQTAEIEVSVDEGCKETFMRVKIFGKNLNQEKDFTFDFTINRYTSEPKKFVQIKYKEVEDLKS